MRRPLFLVCLCLVLVVSIFGKKIRPGTVDLPGESGLDESRVIVTGRVYQKDTDYFYLDSIILIQDAAVPQQSIPLKENLICQYPEGFDDTCVGLGSTVRVSGTFCLFSGASNPGEFDLQNYYHSIKIGGKLCQVKLLASDGKAGWKETLYGIKKYFHGRLYEIFPEKEASVMCTMLLGEKQGLDSELKERYRKNGIVHILSISGLHITIIGMGIYRMLRRTGMPVWMAALVGGSILLLYGVMTGMSVSAVRAIGMYLLKLLSEVVGRTYDMLTALGIMAAVIVCGNPRYLSNAGFYLSFGAVLGIGVVYPALLPGGKEEGDRYEEHHWKAVWWKALQKGRQKLWQSILAGLSITLTTLPVQLWFYYEIPTYSVLLNLFVLPFMGMVVLAGMSAMLVPGLGMLGTIDCLVLAGYEKLCLWCECLPFHTWNPGKPEIWQIAIYDSLLFGMVAVRHFCSCQKYEGRRIKRGWQVILLTLAVITLTCDLPGGTTVTFLDVGQGDSICIQTASGEVYLFDCGSSSRRDVGKYVLKPYLTYYGIHHIDAVFLSHSDSDHCNGVEELLAQAEEWGVTVGRVVCPGDIRAGDNWQSGAGGSSAGSVSFTCLHPSPGEAIEDTNADSQCFYVELENGFSILLTGDVEGRGEEELVTELQKRGIDEVSILKAAHHGSRNSTSEALLKQIKPQVTVISCGTNNQYGHPHEETLERLADAESVVLTTAACGAITVWTDRDIRISGFLQTTAENR